MKGRKLLLFNYFLLVALIIGAIYIIPTLLPAIIVSTNPIFTGVFFSILILILPLTSLFYAYQNIKMYGWELNQFGLLYRIINYTPFFQIFTLLLILFYILLK